MTATSLGSSPSDSVAEAPPCEVAMIDVEHPDRARGGRLASTRRIPRRASRRSVSARQPLRAAACPRFRAGAGSQGSAVQGRRAPGTPRPGRADVDGREQARVSLPVPVLAEQCRRRGAPGRSCCARLAYLRCRSLAARSPSRETPTLTRSARNSSQNSVVEPDAVRVDAQVKQADGLDRGAQGAGDRSQAWTRRRAAAPRRAR